MQFEQYLFWAFQWGMVTACAVVAGAVYIIGFNHGKKDAIVERVQAAFSTIGEEMSRGRHSAVRRPRPNQPVYRETTGQYKGTAATVTQILPALPTHPHHTEFTATG